jgi:hypothetical protein
MQPIQLSAASMAEQKDDLQSDQARRLKDEGCSAFVRGRRECCEASNCCTVYHSTAMTSSWCASGENDEAIRLFSAAISRLVHHTSCPPALQLLLSQLCSNRSAALTALGHHHSALADARRAARFAPLWPKAHLRHGLALVNMGKLNEALQVAEAGLQVQQSHEELQELLDTIKVWFTSGAYLA